MSFMKFLLNTYKEASSQLPPLTFLFRDDFTPDDPNPIATPRTTTDGQTANISDPTAVWSISSGRIVPSGASGNAGAPRYESDGTFTRATGLTLYVAMTRLSAYGSTGEIRWGFSNQFLQSHPLLTIENNGINAATEGITGSEIYPKALDVRQDVFLVLRSTGYFIIDYSGGTYNVEWVGYSGTGSGHKVMAFCYSSSGVGRNFILHDFRLAQLPAPFDSDTGIAHIVNASPAPGTTASAPSNAFHHFQWTPQTAETSDYFLRRTDDNNAIIIRLKASPSGSVKIISKQAGVETELTTSSVTLTVGNTYRLKITANGTNIRVCVDTVIRGNTSGASFNSTATGVKTNGLVVTNWQVYGRTLSVAAQEQLARMMV